MSDGTLIGVILTVVQIAVLFAVILPCVRMMLRGKSTLISVFFCLAMGSYLFSNLYWLVYDCIRPDTRMPFAVNEFAECAMILLLSAGLERVLSDEKRVAWEIFLSFAFIGANIALWILWSSEWIQDILFGIPYVYLLWLIVRGLRSRDILPKKERLGIALIQFLILVLEFVSLISVDVESALLIPLLVIIFACLGWLLFRSIKTRDVFVTSAFFLCTLLAMFSLSEPWYNIAMAADTVAIPILYLSVMKERDRDDIR